MDPTQDQWNELADLCIVKKIIPFFDTAYQGFASGDLVRDGYSVRLFAQKGMEMLAAQSFAKNMGLYGERIGSINIICKDQETSERILSQMKIIVRKMYSNPPIHGAKIVATILGDKELFREWTVELKAIVGRILLMRKSLHDALIANECPGNWDHITKQIGMFSFGGGYAAMPLIQHQVVDTYHWLDGKGFADLVTISQMTPGPIATNAATFVGMNTAGLAGALIATFGCILPSCILVTFIAYFYLKYQKLAALQGILSSLRPAVIALIASAGISILVSAFWNGQTVIRLPDTDWGMVILFGLCIVLLRKCKMNPVTVMFLAGILKVLLAEGQKVL